MSASAAGRLGQPTDGPIERSFDVDAFMTRFERHEPGRGDVVCVAKHRDLRRLRRLAVFASEAASRCVGPSRTVDR